MPASVCRRELQEHYSGRALWLAEDSYPETARKLRQSAPVHQFRGGEGWEGTLELGTWPPLKVSPGFVGRSLMSS